MPSVKRSAPSPVPARRRSGRLSSTPQKSSYFETPDISEDELASPSKKLKKPSSRRIATLKAESSGDQYSEGADDEDEFHDETSEDDVEEDNSFDEDEEADSKPKTRKRRTPQKNAKKSLRPTNGAEDSDVDEDAPMKVTILPLEKMRDAGGVDYEDHKLHRNTLLFLRDLKTNNRRDWLKSHDGEYRRALKDWQSFVEATTSTIAQVDETVPELPVKDVSFRIHRDIRFSKDPTPYKPHFSAAWSRTGRKGPYACYYIHCEPYSNKCFIGGGLWCPEKSHIDKLRRSIDRHPDRWRRVLNEEHLRRVFLLPEAKKGRKSGDANQEAAVEAFAEHNKSTALKVRPKDWSADHRDIALLRLRNYTIGTKISDDIFCADDSQDQIANIIQAMFGYVTFLNNIVMPDPTLDMSSDDEDEQDGEED